LRSRSLPNPLKMLFPQRKPRILLLPLRKKLPNSPPKLLLKILNPPNPLKNLSLNPMANPFTTTRGIKILPKVQNTIMARNLLNPNLLFLNQL